MEQIRPILGLIWSKILLHPQHISLIEPLKPTGNVQGNILPSEFACLSKVKFS